MDTPPILLCALVLVTGCCSALAETCDELETHCRNLQSQLSDTFQDMMSVGWPVTDDKANHISEIAKRNCRLMQECETCLNAFRQRCPERSPTSFYTGWFATTWQIFSAKLCNSPFPPERYLPALYDCYQDNANITHIPSVNPTSPYVSESRNASIAQESACRALTEISVHLNGSAAAVRRKCGDEGAQILLDATDFLLKTNCPR